MCSTDRGGGLVLQSVSPRDCDFFPHEADNIKKSISACIRNICRAQSANVVSHLRLNGMKLDGVVSEEALEETHRIGAPGYTADDVVREPPRGLKQLLPGLLSNNRLRQNKKSGCN